jgi:RNA polymerase sigma-70 factor (ECF subfamily)
MTTFQITQGIQDHQDILKRFALSLTRNEEDANDLLQDTTYRAIKYRKMFKLGTNLKAWLSTIMRNIFLNNYRKKKRMPILLQPEHDEVAMNKATTKVVNDAPANIFISEIQNFCNQLVDEQRIPFLMYCNGFKYKEIADELNTPVGTIKSRIFFARKELKEKYQELYYDI